MAFKIDLAKIFQQQIPPIIVDEFGKGAGQTIGPLVFKNQAEDVPSAASDEISTGMRPKPRVPTPLITVPASPPLNPADSGNDILTQNVAEETLNFPNENGNSALSRPRRVPTPTTEMPPAAERDRIAGNPLDWKIAETQKAVSNPAYGDKPNRLKAALGLALQGIAQTMNAGGDLSQALGAGLGAGAAGAVAPRLFSQMQNRQRLSELTQERTRQNTQNKQNLELLGKRADLEGKVINNRKDELDYLRTANKPLYESVMADAQITEEEAALLKEQGYRVVPYDARKFDRETVNGVTFSTPALGKPDYKPVETLPIDKSKTLKNYTLPSGNKVEISQNQIAQIEMAIAQGDINRATQVMIANNRTTNDNIEADNKAVNDRKTFLAERDKNDLIYTMADNQRRYLEAELQELKNSGAESSLITQKESQVQNAMKVRDEAIAKSLEAQKSFDNYKMPTAKKQIETTPRLSRIPQKSEAEFIKRARGRGITGDNLKAAVQKAREDGIIK